MNQIYLTGRLTRDPELNVEHTPRVNFTIAVDRYSKRDADKTDFFRCVAWGNSAQTIKDCFYKGKGIIIVGRMENNPYEDKNGNTRDSWGVTVEKWEFPQADPRTSTGEHARGNSSSTASTDDDAHDTFEDIDEDVPF